MISVYCVAKASVLVYYFHSPKQRIKTQKQRPYARKKYQTDHNKAIEKKYSWLEKNHQEIQKETDTGNYGRSFG